MNVAIWKELYNKLMDSYCRIHLTAYSKSKLITLHHFIDWRFSQYS